MNATACRFTLLTAAVIALCASVSTADTVYMKDGFALHGKMRREMDVIIDPSTGQPIPIVKGSNMYTLDDRARYIVFGPKQVKVDPEDKNKDVHEGHFVFVSSFAKQTNKGRPSAAIIGEAGPFNEKWERNVAMTITMPAAPVTGIPVFEPQPTQAIQLRVKVRQKITQLSPYYVKLETYEYDWSPCYLTNEFGPDIILPLVRTHVEVKGKPGDPPDFDRQFRVFRFCTQAGWLKEAQQELAKLRHEFPGQTEKLDKAENGLRAMVESREWEEASLASRVGRHSKAQELLKSLKLTDMPALQDEAGKLRAKYDAMNGKLEQVRRALAYCYDDVVGPLTPLVDEAMPAIVRELNYDVLDRLEPFATLGRQLELDAKAGRMPQYTRDQVLAAAITGWVMGPAAAEASEATAERLWRGRERVLDLQRTAAPIDRAEKIETFVREIGLTVDEVARMITLLPPPDLVDLNDPRFAGPTDCQTRVAYTGHAAVKYKLLLPAEYSAHRAHPVLIVMPNAGETTEQCIAPWLAEATKHGYILACVDWGGYAKSKYEYLPDEHTAVLDVISDLKRYLQVDSDRVFLTGSGEAGNAAFDIGMSHPDVFAGVVPINGRPQWYSQTWYWRNAQNLPFYVVIGELTGNVRPWVASIFEKWAEGGYNSLLVLYKGRPTDFFACEIPNIFDWLDRKRRPLGFPELGRNPGAGTGGEEYQTFRITDNRYYWASSERVTEKYTLKAFDRKQTATPAAIQATIRDGNNVVAFTRGIGQLSLWFGRVYDPVTGAHDMIDFSKPLRVTLNSRQNWTGNGKPLTPKMDVLIDDFCRRGDRRRMFFAKVDFDKVQ